MTNYSTALSAKVRASFPSLQPQVFDALEDSIVGNEIPFIKAFVPKLAVKLSSALSGSGVTAATRQVIVHAKPKVDYVNTAGKTVNCELADILFVVKHAQPDGTYEARYAFYQVKCARSTTTTICDIDQTNLSCFETGPYSSLVSQQTAVPYLMVFHQRPVNSVPTF